MKVRIGRTLPPAIAPIGIKNIFNGVIAMFMGARANRAFEEQLKAYFKVSHCFLLSSGKASLTVILKALKTIHPERDEVLIPAYTCYSVPAAIARAGLKVRICDIEPETLDFDYRELTEQLSCQRILCVIPTHLFGVTADIPRVREIIGQRKIVIVEDAAQTMGGECAGRKVGTDGDVGFFSLGRGKAFSTVEGGIILTESDLIATAIKKELAEIPPYRIAGQIKLMLYALVLSIFSHPMLFWFPKALPFLGLGETHFDPNFDINTMSAFQSGLATGWQNSLAELKRIRQRNAHLLSVAGVNAVRGGQFPSSGMIRFPLVVSSIEEKQVILRECTRLGLGVADGYPDTIDGIEELQGSIAGGTSAKARPLAARIISLPVHPYVTGDDIGKLAGILKQNGELAK